MFNRNSMYQPLTNLYSATPKAGFNWGGLLTNTQKTLSIINQAIPVFYQVRPIWNNAKTMFRVMGEMGKISNSRSTTSEQSANTTAATIQTKQPKFNNNNEPNFFI